MNIPNSITIMRILLVPMIIYMIIGKQFEAAFILFLIAGISDAIDGFWARHFDIQTELGAYLDPVADKLLLVSIYLALAATDGIPLWLVMCVVTRDVLIVGGVLLSWLMAQPVAMHPLMISKVNTAVQIAFAALVLAEHGYGPILGSLIGDLAIGVGILTVLSAAAYLMAWIEHLTAAEENPAHGSEENGDGA